MTNTTLQKRTRRAARTRERIGHGTAERPRLSVFRSNRHIYAQLIDDVRGVTLVSASSFGRKPKKGETKTDVARNVGIKLAKLATAQDIKTAVFDRGGYRYHGRVRALAEAARDGGLEF